MYEDENEEIDEALFQNLEDFENQRDVLSDIMGAMGKDSLVSKDDTSREMMLTPAPEKEDYELLLVQMRRKLEKIKFFEDVENSWGELKKLPDLPQIFYLYKEENYVI